MATLLETRDLKKHYTMGTSTVRALDFWLIGDAIGFSIAISLIPGSYPAARAARLDPIQALRHD